MSEYLHSTAEALARLSVAYTPEELVQFLTPSGLSAESQEIRRGRVTGTRAAMILGESEFGDEQRALTEILDLPHPNRSNRHMEFGNWAEGMLGLMHSNEHGVKLFRPSPATILHPTHDWLCSSLDFVALDAAGEWDYLVECKSTDEFNRDKWGATGTDVVPAGYHIQAALELACTGLEVLWWELLVGQQRRPYRIVRELGYENNLLTALGDWYDRHVRRGEPLTGQGAREVADAIVPGRDNGRVRDARDEAETVAIVEELARATSELKAAEARVDGLKQELAAAIGQDAAIEIGWGTIPFRWEPGRRTADAKALERLARAHGARETEIGECFREGEGGRVLRPWPVLKKATKEVTA